MFGLFESVDNVVGIAGKLLDGEDISQKQVSQLATDVVEAVVLAEAVDIGVDLLKSIGAGSGD